MKNQENSEWYYYGTLTGKWYPCSARIAAHHVTKQTCKVKLVSKINGDEGKRNG